MNLKSNLPIITLLICFLAQGYLLIFVFGKNQTLTTPDYVLTVASFVGIIWSIGIDMLDDS